MEALEGKEQIITKIDHQVSFLRELQSDCNDEMLWHDYMRKIDELESQLDLLTRR